MVFIALGTQGNQFQRCLKLVEQLIEEVNPSQEFIAQVGNTKYASSMIKCLDYVPESEFKELIGRADVVITHGGSGSLLSAIKQGKKVIAVARLKKYREMVDDHQTELVTKLSREGYILDGTRSVVEAWKQLDGFVPRKHDFECTIPDEIDALLSKWGVERKRK